MTETTDLGSRLDYHACAVAARYPKAADTMRQAACEIGRLRARVAELEAELSSEQVDYAHHPLET